MPVPKYYQFFPSILDCLADGKEHNLKEVAEYCANKFNLSAVSYTHLDVYKRQR